MSKELEAVIIAVLCVIVMPGSVALIVHILADYEYRKHRHDFDKWVKRYE